MSLVVQFVDAISATPTNRLHLSQSPWTTLASTDFGLPELKQSVAATLMGDGEHVAASAYANRVLTLQLQVNTATVDDTITEMQKLMRELNRDRPILKVQLDDTTAPVFFRCYRSSPAGWEFPTVATRVNLAAEILAEPFAYGLLETPVNGATLDTNPANANGQYLDVATVLGDVETPAMIRWPSTAAAANRETLFAVRRRGTPSAAPFLFQAEALTQGTNTTTQANDALFSGAGNNWSRCTFTTATLATRLTLTDLGTASVDLRGTYRVLLRCRKSTSTDDINVNIEWGESGFTQTTNDAVTLPDTTSICMADLGLIQVPRGWDPRTHLLSGTEVAASDTFEMEIQAERTAGAGNLDFDYVLLVPADDRLAIVKFVHAGPDRWWLNAHDNTAHARNSSDQIASANTPGITGGLPMLTPNQSNRIYISYEVGSGKATTLTTTTVTISYYPRYLTIRPAST